MFRFHWYAVIASRIIFALCSATLLLSIGQVFAAVDEINTITNIEFEGNDVTEAEVLIQEIIVKEGKRLDREKIERSRQNIMDLGLFKSVQTKSRSTPEGVEVTFVVDEKRFWYFVPVFSRGSDGDTTFGLRLQMDNLLGNNSYLTVRAKSKDFKDTDIQSEETFEVEYLYPRIFGSEYDFGFQFDYDEADIEEMRGNLAGEYFREKTSLGLILSRWLTTSGPSKGLRLSLGLRTDIFKHEFLGGDPNLFTDLTVNSFLAGFEYYDVVDHDTYRSGTHYGLEFESASSVIGSDIAHSSHNLFYRRYLPVNPDTGSNLNLQIKLGAISESVFGDATYQIASGTTVRGYERDSIEGDAFYLANLEYLRQIGSKDVVRGVAFMDVGSAFEDLGNLDFGDPRFGVGVGLRWKIRSFVKTDLRVDIAHGLGEGGDTRIYAGTRATF